MDENNKVELSEESEKRVAKAVAKEVKKFSIKDIGIKDIITIVLVIVILVFGFSIYKKMNDNYSTLKNGLSSLVSFDENVEGYDLTLDNKGILGYLAADFEDAIIGDASSKKEVVVYTQEVSDVATLTDTGLFNWSALTKTQLITYKGTVDYYVDLSKLDKDSIKYDEETNTVTIYIPHALRKDININEKDIEYADPINGLLAFGDIKSTPEQLANVQSQARTKMEEKLEKDNVIETADRFAKLTIWEIYSPIVKSVGEDVSLVVEFEN